jgi:hypothetical protein
VEIILKPSGYAIQLPDEVRSLAENAQSEMMDTKRLLHLAATLAACAWGGGAIVVEIGAFAGRTTVFMAEVLRLLGWRVPILSIDPFERAEADSLNPQGIYSAYLETVQGNGVADVCLPLVAFSQDAAPVVPAQVGVLVIDGDHHYPGVSKDLELYAPKVLRGGFIFVDDHAAGYPDVIRAVDEYFRVGTAFTLLHKSNFVIAQRRPALTRPLH